ncbi:MAG: protein-glutamate O-methyltransferase CheR [Planctomycetota bacterium]
MTVEEFRRMSDLIRERTGIHLPETKLTLLSNRLRRRLRVLELSTYQDYYDLLLDSKRCEEELPHFLSAVTTNETYFFRNEKLWEFMRQKWIPEIVKIKAANRTLRVWSAASSSGEEAYTTAICLREHLPEFSKWKVMVIGTDISQKVLDKARGGEFNDYAVSKVEPAILKRWFDQKDAVFHLKPEIRQIVQFKFHNLRDRFQNAGFDLIFLRNVLMYFDLEMKQVVLRNVQDALSPGGHLIVGDVDPIRHTKELMSVVTLESCGPNLYRKSEKHSAVAATAGRS